MVVHGSHKLINILSIVIADMWVIVSRKTGVCDFDIDVSLGFTKM
jgi:hypothetical protein